MMRFRTIAAVAALSVTASASAAAQTCLGLPDLTVTRASLGAEIQFPKDAKSYSGRLGVNSQTAFGGLSVGYITLDDDLDELDVNATTVGGDIGLERHIGTNKRIHVCPVASLAYTSGPNIDALDLKSSTIQGGLGVAFGGSIPMTPTVSFVPFARAGLLVQRTKFEVVGEDSDTESETGGLLGLGASFRFNDIFAITPSVLIPVGFDDSDAVFSLGATIGFRRR
ncbi:MAG: hypothetical protein V4617_01460 [Gemmatimonadota bacterium]